MRKDSTIVVVDRGKDDWVRVEFNDEGITIWADEPGGEYVESISLTHDEAKRLVEVISAGIKVPA